MGSRRRQKVRPNSTQWFVNALSHPDLACHQEELRAVCGAADRLHRTVSGSVADKIKAGFLGKLRKIIMQSDRFEPRAISIKIHELIVQAKLALKRLEDTPAENPNDWKLKIKVTQVRTKHGVFSGRRGFQGGAPQ